MTRNTFLVMLFATMSGLVPCVSTAEEEAAAPAPDQVVMDFLKWYLPVAFKEGSQVILDKRMDGIIESKLLAKWRALEKEEHGYGAVPFVGQDYADAWANNFKVTKVEAGEAKTDVTVRYSAPEWTTNLKITLVKTDDGWRITNYMPIE